MKKVFLGMFITAFLLACNNEKKESKASTDESTTANSSDKKNADELLDISEGDGVKNSVIAFSTAMLLNFRCDSGIRTTGNSRVPANESEGRSNIPVVMIADC